MVYKVSKNNSINPIEPSCKKTIYYTLEEAQDMIKHINENRSLKKINAYKCMICGFWHLTSKT
jgi:hypothetical protein